MPRTRSDRWVYYWTDGQVYGPERYVDLAAALEGWEYDAAVDTDQPRLGLCILDEVNHIAYIRPNHPNSVKNPEKMTKRMLERSGREREAKWVIKEME